MMPGLQDLKKRWFRLFAMADCSQNDLKLNQIRLSLS